MSKAGSNHGKKYIGIDLGTTYSEVAYLNPVGKAETVPNSEGEPMTPSVVLFDKSGQVIVGREAKRSLLVEPDRVADCVKRDIGDRYYNRPINGKRISPVHISAMIIKKLKQDTEARIGPIGGAVITVPAYFDETRRRATKVAGEVAGITVIDILNEPTAAAMAYAFRDFLSRGGDATDLMKLSVSSTAKHKALIYDLGGGTLDVTILSIDGDNLTVLATDGDVQLGGRDWDERIVGYAAGEFKKKHGSDPLTSAQTHQAMLLAAEDAKRSLSVRPNTQVAVTHDGRTLSVELTREQFEELTADLLYRTEARLTSVIEQAKLTWDGIDEILSVGGSSKMPQVLAMLKRVTGKDPNCSLPPGEAIAHGAAIHAAIRAVDAQFATGGRDFVPRQPMPRATARDIALGMADYESIDSELSGGGSIPQEGPDLDVHSFKLPEGEKPTEQFDPDVTEMLRGVTQKDVNAHSLGVVANTRNEIRVNAILIPRNTQLPATKTGRFGTNKANQSFVEVRVLEGESTIVEECIEIGKCFIRELPPNLPAGSPVDVTFTYDGSGLLHVHAVDVTSGKSAKATIQSSLGWTDEQIDTAKQKIKRMSVI